MIIRVNNEENFPLNSTQLNNQLKKFLHLRKVPQESEVEITIVSDSVMKKLGREYLREFDREPHNVLSFVTAESKVKFVYPDNINRIGEVVICFEKAKGEAEYEGVSLDEKIYELAEHGVRHLLGEHHEDKK